MKSQRKTIRLAILLIALAFAYVMFSSWGRQPQREASSREQQRMVTSSRPSQEMENNRSSCLTPRKNVAFLKVHKSSSSTVQNILFRYGEKHNFSFALPRTANYFNGKHGKFLAHTVIQSPDVKEYNIMCHHTRYDEKAISDFMPSGTIYVSILRSPVTLFESIFTYMVYKQLFGMKGDDPIDNLRQFLLNPNMYYDILKKQPDGESMFRCGHLKNSMLYDFGLDIENMNSESAINAKIASLMSKFDLIMITEYLHESLILLKELLCWTMDDIVFFSLNARTYQYGEQIAPQMGVDILQWNQGDSKLYDIANQTFWKKVERFGFERMKREVTVLKEYNRYLFNLCIEDVENNPLVWHPVGVKVNSLKVKSSMRNNSLCVKMATPELEYTRNLRRKLQHLSESQSSTQSPSTS